MSMNNPEDTKLVTLATSTLARSGAQQAAALRDNTGRTYVAINVTSPSLNLDAFIESVVAAGSQPANSKAIKDFAPTATIFYINSDGKESAL
ncbi:MAG: hypothetical protein RLZ23_1196 [Actinomycetota bacterium]